jgi:hypothetical protein
VNDAATLTGHAPNPITGLTSLRTPLLLRREQLPLEVMFEGRTYVIAGTAGGGLQMTKR